MLEICFEDGEECSFQAINRPLQQRTTVLNLDYSRANALPADYQTDLDFEWGNPGGISLVLNSIISFVFRFIR